MLFVLSVILGSSALVFLFYSFACAPGITFGFADCASSNETMIIQGFFVCFRFLCLVD